MGDSENVQQASRKRGALKELSRDNPGLDDEEDSAGLESGTFQKASDEVLASRRIVRVKRKEPSVTPAAVASNPFAGICLVPATAPVTTAVAESKVAPAEAVVEEEKAVDDNEEGDEVDSKKIDVKDDSTEEVTEKVKDDSTGEETEKVKDEGTVVTNAVEGTDETEVTLEKDSGGDESKEADKNGDTLSSFQQHSSSKNAFTGLAGTEASGSSFSFSVVSQDGSTGSAPLFAFGLPSSNNTSLFSSSGSSIIKKSEGSAFPAKGDVSTETGEENETVAFSADSIMFEYLDGGWKERGKGGLKVNVSGNGKGRLVMRAKGNYRLILNASLYPEMKLASMDKKGITFACVNSIGEGEGKEGLSTFALKFKDPVIVEEFRVAVDKHKDVKPLETTAPLKTPENSPTSTDA